MTRLFLSIGGHSAKKCLIYFGYGKDAKKNEKKLTSVSFMYVCVAENGEILVFFPNNSLIDNSLSE